MIRNTHYPAQYTQPSFQGFAKFKAEPQRASELAKEIKSKLPEGFVFWDRKGQNDKTYYIITDSHQDKFLDKIGKVELNKLKNNIEKYMGEKAEKLSLKKVESLLKKDEFKI